MTFLSYATAAILGGLAFLHMLWGLRIWWPIPNELELARAVTGFPNISSMPSASACVAVASALALVAVISLELGGASVLRLPAVTSLAGFAAAAVFLARGAAGYTEFWARLTPEQPFRALDQAIYSPLCLGLGVCLGLLSWVSSVR